jgi:myo-inositol-1(or 4)-monophosphatase
MGVRRDGCASLDLCYVACGRTDGFCEHDLQPWDVAAGLLILAEAGGRATDFEDRPADPWAGDFLASNGLLHGQLLETLTRASDSR